MQSEQYWIFIFYIYPASLKTLPFRTSTRHPSTNELKHHLTPCPSPKRRGESPPSPLGEGLGLPARSRFGKGRDGVIKRIMLPVHDLLFKFIYNILQKRRVQGVFRNALYLMLHSYQNLKSSMNFVVKLPFLNCSFSISLM